MNFCMGVSRIRMHAGACNIIHAAKTGAGHNTHTEQHYGGFHVRLNICVLLRNLYTAIQTRCLSLVWRDQTLGFDRAARADLLFFKKGRLRQNSLRSARPTSF